MPMKKKHSQNGFSMVEVLVALLVLATGVLGAVALQTLGLTHTQGAYTRSQASILAYDMTDRMRANPDGVTAGYYNAITSSSPPISPNCIATAAGCTSQQLADQDIREWSEAFNDVTGVGADGTATYAPLLPGNGTVTGNSSTFVITVSWTENDFSNAEGGKTAAISKNVQLNVTL